MVENILGYKLEILTKVGTKFEWCNWGYFPTREEAKKTARDMMHNNLNNVKAFTVKTIKGE